MVEAVCSYSDKRQLIKSKKTKKWRTDNVIVVVVVVVVVVVTTDLRKFRA